MERQAGKRINSISRQSWKFTLRFSSPLGGVAKMAFVAMGEMKNDQDV